MTMLAKVHWTILNKIKDRKISLNNNLPSLINFLDFQNLLQGSSLQQLHSLWLPSWVCHIKMASSIKPRAYKQDLPPKGGYAPVNFVRIPARKLVRGKDHT